MQSMIGLIAALAIFAPALAQEPAETPAQREARRQEIKRFQREAKEQEKRDKEERKQRERLEAAKPAMVVIAATPERIKARLVMRMADKGYTIESDTPYQIAFHKQNSGVEGALMGDYGVQFNLSPQDAETAVYFRLFLTSRQAYGGRRRDDVTERDRKWRVEYRDILSDIKQRLEAEQAQ